MDNDDGDTPHVPVVRAKSSARLRRAQSSRSRRAVFESLADAVARWEGRLLCRPISFSRFEEYKWDGTEAFSPTNDTAGYLHKSQSRRPL
jgi:hypothetical protein